MVSEKFKVFGNFLVEQYGKHGIGTQKMLETQRPKLHTTDEAIALENNGATGIYYAKKEATDLIGAGVRFPVQLQERIASNASIRSFDTKVNRKIADVTQSQQFKRWFGDWQNHPESASKVVNADGTPMVVYHGVLSQHEETARTAFGWLLHAYGVFRQERRGCV